MFCLHQTPGLILLLKNTEHVSAMIQRFLRFYLPQLKEVKQLGCILWYNYHDELRSLLYRYLLNGKSVYSDRENLDLTIS